MSSTKEGADHPNKKSVDALKFEEFIELLKKPDVLKTLAEHPDILDRKPVKPGERKTFVPARSAFIRNLTIALANQCIFVPQSYIAICPNSQARKFVGTTGMSTCVGCVFHSSDFTALCHYDGESDQKQAKEAQFSKLLKDGFSSIGPVATLVYEKSQEKFLAEKLKQQLNQHFGACQLRSGNSTDGCFVVLGNGLIVALADSEQYKFGARDNAANIKDALRLPEGAALYRVESDGNLILQDISQPYEKYTIDDTRKNPEHREGMMIPKDVKNQPKKNNGLKELIDKIKATRATPVGGSIGSAAIQSNMQVSSSLSVLDSKKNSDNLNVNPEDLKEYQSNILSYKEKLYALEKNLNDFNARNKKDLEMQFKAHTEALEKIFKSNPDRIDGLMAQWKEQHKRTIQDLEKERTNFYEKHLAEFKKIKDAESELTLDYHSKHYLKMLEKSKNLLNNISQGLPPVNKSKPPHS